VYILVVADACTDQTVDAARAGQAQVISISARNVGMARARPFPRHEQLPGSFSAEPRAAPYLIHGGVYLALAMKLAITVRRQPR
jgi:hypothetical protein